MKRNGSRRGHTVLCSDGAGFGITVSGSVDLRALLEQSTAATCAAFLASSLSPSLISI